MKIEQLEYFVQICHYGTINKVANQMHISPQAISAAIKQLESELDCSLFTRQNSKKLNLSPYGEIFLPAAEEILHVLENAVIQMETMKIIEPKDSFPEHLNIWVSPVIALGIINPVIERFHKKCPTVSYSFEEMENKEIHETLNEKDGVAIFISFKELESNDSLIYHLIAVDKCYALISSDNSLADQKSISLNTLLKYPLAIYQSSIDVKNLVPMLLEERGKPCYYVISSSFSVYLKAIQDNHNVVGFCTKTMKREFLADISLKKALDELKLLPIKNFPPLYIYIAYKREYFEAHQETLQLLSDAFHMILA